MTDRKAIIESVKQSYKRCVDSGNFFDVFYDDFLDQSDSIAAKFDNTNWAQQKSLLQHAIRSAILYAEEPNVSVVAQHMKSIGKTHSRTQLDIHPEWYPIWLACIVEAVEKCDPEFSTPLGEAWKKVLTPAIELITSKYNSE